MVSEASGWHAACAAPAANTRIAASTPLIDLTGPYAIAIATILSRQNTSYWLSPEATDVRSVPQATPKAGLMSRRRPENLLSPALSLSCTDGGKGLNPAARSRPWVMGGSPSALPLL